MPLPFIRKRTRICREATVPRICHCNRCRDADASSGNDAGPSPTPVLAVTSATLPDNSYDLTLTASQLLYNGSVIPAIRGANYSQDASIFALRDTLDRMIATVRQQFYLVILNRSLIGVQEESVHLLEQQLQDQQNRFEAGTVPRFNVLQAEVALANQQPSLITARNNYRIAQLQLAKTIGLDYDPARRAQAPLRLRRRTDVSAAGDAACAWRLKLAKSDGLCSNSSAPTSSCSWKRFTAPTPDFSR